MVTTLPSTVNPVTSVTPIPPKNSRVTWTEPATGACASAVAANDQGFVTSAAWSPTLGHAIALALLEHGPDRHGERIIVHDPVRGGDVEAEICHPVFVDPEGVRVRG